MLLTKGDNKMEHNKAELIGRVNWKEAKEHTNGAVIRFLLSKKIREGEYATFPVTMFGEDGVKAYQALDKGDYGHFIGRLTISSFVRNEKRIDRMEFIANKGERVEYDVDNRTYYKAPRVGKTVVQEKAPWEE